LRCRTVLVGVNNELGAAAEEAALMEARRRVRFNEGHNR
jgi:hypothetical protein